MKKIILLFALILSSALYQAANAQVGINVNIGSQPVWGPSGYDYAEYYYFPDIDVYYHIADGQYVYYNGGNWVSDYSLPACYSNFDLYRSYKVVINEPQPFLRNNFWHSRYYAYRGRPQEIIYNSRNPKYYVIGGHPQHNMWMASRPGNNRIYNNGPVNYGRNDNRGFDNRRFNNNQRANDMSRNDRGRNDNRNWNDNRGGGHDRFNGRRN